MADKKPEPKKVALEGRFKNYKSGSGKTTSTYCPKCGEGFYLAQHDDRVYCGKCKYTEFGKK